MQSINSENNISHSKTYFFEMRVAAVGMKSRNHVPKRPHILEILLNLHFKCPNLLPQFVCEYEWSKLKKLENKKKTENYFLETPHEIYLRQFEKGVCFCDFSP